MKPLSIPFAAIAYLVVLLMGYMAGGYILSAYNVNHFILIGNCLVTLRLAQTGSPSISLAIAWISLWIWGASFGENKIEDMKLKALQNLLTSWLRYY